MTQTNLESQENSVLKRIDSYLKLGETMANPPRITLSAYTQSTNQDVLSEVDIAVSAAMQCYGAGTTKLKERVKDNEQRIGQDTLRAGHQTTRQHWNGTFHFEGVTREVTELVLHSYAFYNSEQQSQRYRLATRGDVVEPTDLSDDQRSHYLAIAKLMNDSYFEYLELLDAPIDQRLHLMYPAGGWKVPDTKKRYEDKGKKLAQEVARYFLPIGQKTTMYHTLNALQVIRFFRSSELNTMSDEAKFIFASMVDQILKVDPRFIAELELPLEEERTEFQSRNQHQQTTAFKQKFDARLGERAATASMLLPPGMTLQAYIQDALEIFYGQTLSEEELEVALGKLIDPAENPLLADVYETGINDPLTRAFGQFHGIMQLRLSHTAQSQFQRHRLFHKVVPLIEHTFTGDADYLIPMIIREDPTLKAMYVERMERIYAMVREGLDMGIPLKYMKYLLPNAHILRVQAVVDFPTLIHFLKQRLCLLAQEEVCFAAIDIAEQLLEQFPQLIHVIGAPCNVNTSAKKSPRCPEGKRWCGVPVWKHMISNFRRLRLV